MKQLFTGVLLLMTCAVFGQRASSPYSRFGIGQLGRAEQTHLRAMGYSSTAYVDSVATNLSNPATLGNKAFSSFDIGLTLNNNTLTDDNFSNSILDAGLTHLAYSFPVNKKQTWGIAIGAVPFSSKKYDVTTPLENNTFFRDFEGEGNTQRLFLQNGVEVFDNFTLGVDASLFFGSLEDHSLNTFISNFDNSAGSEIQQKLRGYNIKLGGQYTYDIKEDLDITFGATYQLESDIDNEVTTNDFFYRVIQIEQVTDDLFDLIEFARFDEVETVESQDMTLPSIIGLGAFIRKPQKWSLGVDAKLGQWQDFQAVNDSPTIEYRNSVDLSVGGSFIPNYRNPKKAFERFEYRYGVHYSQTYLTIADTEINDFGVTLGTSIPIRQNARASIRRVPSSIDFGLDIGQMGTLDNNLVRDSYIKASFGLNLNDVWFERRRYD